MANPNGNTANLKPFPPGVSGNPAGRPRKRPISEAYDDLVRLELPEKIRLSANLPKGSTWADAIALSMARQALKGDVPAAKEVREAIEGKSVQRVELTSPEDKGFEVRVTFELPVPERERRERVLDVEPQVANEVKQIVVSQAIEETE